jgi:hypothetical protein
MRSAFLCVLLALAPLAAVGPAFAQGAYDPAPRIAAQKEAMKALAMLDGEWRGEAKTLAADGSWHSFTQTERVGTMLDGSVRVIEGRGYEADGSVNFNAFAVISYDPDKKTYAMRSYSGGRAGDFPITPTATGFTWEIQAGPNMKMSYEATVKDGVWTETGTRIPKDGQPVKFIAFAVTRLGDATWPAAGAVQPR